MSSDSTGPVGVVDPPPDVVSNFENPQDADHNANFISLIVCATLITSFFAVRLYVKGWIIRHIMLEDWTCLIAYVGQVLYLWTVFMMGEHKLGYHAWGGHPGRVLGAA